ncbi:MAG TPA: hypothetical protein VMZ91_07805 [Candidatus Paceibacterota bacterium]|nr:hypothetical protein [Candidatus Paceibacterota bacterium]
MNTIQKIFSWVSYGTERTKQINNILENQRLENEKLKLEIEVLQQKVQEK